MSRRFARSLRSKRLAPVPERFARPPRRLGAAGLVAAVSALALAHPGAAPARSAAPHRPRHDPPGATRDAARSQPGASGVTYSAGPIQEISSGCPGTGDTSEATDPAAGYVYVGFEGCDHDDGIGFVRSLDGGGSYSAPVALPESHGAWDPSLAVAPNGTLYVAFMRTVGGKEYPIIDVSRDHGQTFTVETGLEPEQSHDWGDAEYLAVAPNGTLYVAWAYGPTKRKSRERCAHFGSCWATNGGLNVVVQSSTDEARSFSPISVVTPGYPDAGADEGAIAVEPDGAVGVLYQDYEVVDERTLKLAHGHEFFVSSADGGRTWSSPVEVGAAAGQITIDEWWNDGSIGVDPAGDLYAAWDTQSGSRARRTDTGWLSFSTDGGREWSAPVRATHDSADAPHIMQVIGGPPGEAYAGWLSDSDPRGYAEYLRTFSVAGGWLSPAERISPQFGEPAAFPGDTFGLAALSPTELALAWGSGTAATGGEAAVFAASVAVEPLS